MIFTTAAIVMGQPSLWAQADLIYGSPPPAMESAAPVVIRVAEDIDDYLEEADDSATQSRDLVRRADRTQTQSNSTSLEITSENWFARSAKTHAVSLDRNKSTNRLAELTTPAPRSIIDQRARRGIGRVERASPSDRQMFSDELIARQTKSPAARSTGFDPKTDKRRITVAQAQRLVPRVTRPQPQQASGLPWFILPIVAVPLAWFGVQFYREQKAIQQSAVACEGCEVTTSPCSECPEAGREPSDVERHADTSETNSLIETAILSTNDDLTRIYGIGPATADLLHQEGVTSFSDLATTDTETFENILAAAGSRFQLIDPSTWSTQAQYAAGDDWSGLEAWRAAELEAMVSESDDFDITSDACDQELAALDDANSLLASVSRIRRDSDSYELYEEGELEEESGYAESRYDDFDFEERGYEEIESNSNDWSSTEEDDLTQIRGIGSATRELLRDNGIRSFGDLVELDAGRLQDILDQAGSRFKTANPEAWITHARKILKTANL